jgi:membrane protease YdiL (CAAX protease family)
VTQTDQLNPPAAVGLEIAVALCGLWLLWRFVLSPRAPRAEARLPEWKIPAIDFACYTFFAIAGFIALSALAGVAVRHIHLSSDATKVLGGAVQDIGLLLGLYGFHLFYRKHAPVTEVRSPVSSIIKSGATTFFIAMLLVDVTILIWSFALTKLGLPMANQEFVDIAQSTGSGWLKASLMAIAVVLAPATEEIVFRGGLFRYFRTRIPRWTAIGLTSFLFGALHVSWDSSLVGLPSFAPMVVLAMVFCLAYERTGSLGTVIVAHALFNTYTFVLVAAGLRS